MVFPDFSSLFKVPRLFPDWKIPSHFPRFSSPSGNPGVCDDNKTSMKISRFPFTFSRWCCWGIPIPRSHEYAWAPIRPLPLGVSAITKPDPGNCHPGIATGPFKKARPKRALHYRDYQLPDHLYRLRENSNKRHTPNIQDNHRCIPTWWQLGLSFVRRNRVDVSQCQLLGRPVRAKQCLWQDSSSDHQQHLLAERIPGNY